MRTTKGFIEEIYLEKRHAARITYASAQAPAPGQYLLATTELDTCASLAQPIYPSGIHPSGFYAAPPLPPSWIPGTHLNLRGPFGHGFKLPGAAHRVALAGFSDNCARVLALLEPALSQKSVVVLLSNQPPMGLPAAVEILPLAALMDTVPWADYLAIQISRERLPEFLELLLPERKNSHRQTKSLPPRSGNIQLLVETPVPCGGLAGCGVCAVKLHPGRNFMLACKDGPVFDL